MRAQPKPVHSEYASTDSTNMLRVSTPAPTLSHASTAGRLGGVLVPLLGEFVVIVAFWWRGHSTSMPFAH